MYFFRAFCLLRKKQSCIIAEIVDAEKSYELFFTHNCGDGTELYVQNYLHDKKDMLVIRNCSCKRDFYYSIENMENNKKILCKPSSFFELIDIIDCKQITINSLFSYCNLTMLINKIVQISEARKIPLSYMLHDYYCICPNLNLIAGGEYCKLQCQLHNCVFDVCLDSKMHSVYDWRNLWTKIFEHVSEIYVFSKSSRDIFFSVYPNIAENKFQIIPHNMDYCKFTPIKDIFPFHIGIIGNCVTEAKGRYVVKNLLRYVKKMPVPITIIGRYLKRDKIKSRNIKYTGEYKRSELQSFIEKEQISVVFFPSIWPETFSYLVSELIFLNIPIVCFDYGAQAEKMKNYNKGYICESSSPEVIIQTIYNAIAFTN
jgi:glycosyltransferase involved in cell wall biosynthesis